MSRAKNRRSRYQNAVGISSVGTLLLFGAVGLGVAFTVIHLKNLEHGKEEEKLALREEIEDLQSQTHMLTNEFLKECSAERIRARISANGSRLREIPQGAVIRVDSPIKPEESVTMR
ncbi:hypothetical protein OAF27_00635 [Verrucomicrobiales bacterium]|nr:hypothetical protein [Verrucomicrobiales bacterium]